MAASTAAVTALAPSDGRSRRGRLLLAGGARTTIHVACHDADRTELRVAVLPGQERLEPWCVRHGVRRGARRRVLHPPGRAPARRGPHARHRARARAVRRAVARVRACVHVEGGRATIARRDRARPPSRAAISCRPARCSCAGGEVAYDPDADAEGFRAAPHQFDSDIRPTGRHPRAALGLGRRADRSRSPATAARAADAGLTLLELARLMVALGAREAINLDGGGSTALVSGGRLQQPPARATSGPPAGRAADRHGPGRSEPRRHSPAAGMVKA